MKIQKIPKIQEQDKSSDIEQQPPFSDRKISNIKKYIKTEKNSLKC